jgi:hypothetical protein
MRAQRHSGYQQVVIQFTVIAVCGGRQAKDISKLDITNEGVSR